MLSLLSFALAAPPLSGRVAPGEPLIWAGIDYSIAEFYVPERFDDPEARVYWGPGGGLDDRIGRYPTPEAVFTQLTADWNAMFVNELGKKVEKGLDVRLVRDLPEADGQTIRREGGWFRAESAAASAPSTVDAAAVKARVAAWSLTSTKGTGFGVIADRFSKAEDQGCLWPVYFDVASREVLWTERICKRPTGMEFRNYWYNPLVDVVKEAVKAGR